MKVKKLKKDKVKRSRIILSSILTMAIALLSLGFGAYLGYVTLNINYVTIGTMTPMVGGLLVVAGFFIFFGCVGGVIALKEIFISSKNEEKFSVYKPALISAVVYYVIIAIICIVGFIMSLVSYVPSNFTWTILALSIFSLLLCGGAFYCVLRELKEHKKNKKKSSGNSKNIEENPLYNMNMSAEEIRKFREFYKETKDAEINRRVEELSKKLENNKTDEDKLTDKEKALKILYSEAENKEHDETKEKVKDTLDFCSLSKNLKQLEDLRKSGLINDQEYQELKRSLL